MEDIIISDKKRFERIKRAITGGGTEKIHILADLDRTLTKVWADGRSFPTLTSILRDGDFFDAEYAVKAQVLYDKYRPIEIDEAIPFEQKKACMREWWMSHFKLLIEFGLSRQLLQRVAASDRIRPRDGADEFFAILRKSKVPLVVMSSSGLGVDGIELFLRRNNFFDDNIFIVSNRFEWDESGRAERVVEPIITSLNKDETMVRDFQFFGKIKDRKNVILLGDNPEDAKMAAGFDCDNLLKIGFLNENVEENRKCYEQVFDVIIANDGSMDFVNGLLKDILR